MNKSGKLLILATGIVALSCGILQTSAESSNEVTLEILEGQSSCSGEDYDFSGYDVSATDIDLNAVTHNVNCVLLSSNSGKVTVELPNDLRSQENYTIPASGFTFITQAGTTNGSLDADVAETTPTEFHSEPKKIYQKGAYKVGNLTDLPLTLDGVVPGGTPKGVYTGELDITTDA